MEPQHRATTDPHLTELLKYPIVFALMFTSVPAGFLPTIVFVLAMEEARTAHPNRAPGDDRIYWIMVACAIGFNLIHWGLTFLARKYSTRSIAGLRGKVWLVILWLSYLVGIAMGVLLWFMKK
jgi:hypothetical protein